MAEPRITFGELAPRRSIMDAGSEPAPFADEFDATVRQQAWYQAVTQFRRNMVPPESGYDATQHLAGFEKYSEDILATRSTREVEMLKRQIQENEADKEIMSRSGWHVPILGRFGITYPNLMAGAIANPANLIPVPFVSGLGFVKGAALASTSGAAITAGEELLRAQADPTYELPETVFAVGASFLTAGIMGGVSGKYGPRVAQKARELFEDERGTLNMSLGFLPIPRKERNAPAQRFVEAIASNESPNTAKSVNFRDEGFEVERGPTGLRHDDGSYRPVAIVERDVETGAPPAGFVRLYRAQSGERNVSPAEGQPEWLQQAIKGSDHEKASGRWFTTDRDAIEWYMRDNGERATLTHVDVPEADLEGYRVSNIEVTDDGLTPRAFSRDPENEYFLPREIADQRKPVERLKKRFVKVDEAAIKTHYLQDGRLSTISGSGGVTSLPEGSLLNEDEAVTFSILREMWKEHLPPNTGEAPAAYAQRLNDAVLKELAASREASSSAGTLGPWLDKLNRSPVARAIRLFKNDNVLTDAPLRLAGDYGWAVRANKFGFRTPPSVLIRSQKHFGSLKEVKQVVDQKFNEAIRGPSKSGPSMSFGSQNLETSMHRGLQRIRAWTSRGEEVLTYDVFRKMVGQAVFDQDDFSVDGFRVLPQAREAAAEITRKLADYDRQMLELGMFHDQKSATRKIQRIKDAMAWREAAMEKHGWVLEKEKSPADIGGGDVPDPAGAPKGERAKLFKPHVHEYLLDLEDQWHVLKSKLDKAEHELKTLEAPHKFKSGENFWPRLWDTVAILADRERFTKLIETYYVRTGEPDGAAARAEKTVARILGEEQHSLGHQELDPRSKEFDEFLDDLEKTGPGPYLGSRHLYKRRLDIPNAYEHEGVRVRDFINTDALSTLETYFQRVGTAIEMHKAFGDFELEELLDNIERHIDSKYGPKEGMLAKKSEYLNYLKLTRDWMLGRLNQTDPWRWDNRVAQNVGTWTQMAMLGGAVLSSTVELVRVPMVSGFANAFRAPIAALSGDLSRLGKHLDWMRKESGEALEMVRDHNILRHAEDAAGISHPGTRVERWLQNRVPGFFKMTLLTQWTVLVKDYAMLTSQHVILHEASEMARARKMGVGIPEQTQFRLAALGIGEREAMLLAEMPFETLTGGNLLLPAIHKWTGPDGERAQRILLDAVMGETRRTVVTPSIADKSTLFAGVWTKGGQHAGESGLYRLPLQFMSYGIASHNKILTSALQGRDRSVYMGFAAMMGMGYAINYFKTPEYAWENQSYEERLLRAYELSGFGGYWMGDINRTIENVSGDTIGVRPTLGMEPLFGESNRGGDQLEVFGPGPDMFWQLGRAYWDEEMLPTQRAQLIRHAIIYNNVWYWRNLTRKAARNWAEPPEEDEE